MTVDDLILKYDVDRSGECWLWTRSVNTHGYGHFRVNGKLRTAHRFFYEAATGEDIAGKVVLHKCDNPRCVKPSHLSSGTQLDNIADRVAKGRNGACRGDSSPWAKVTSDDIARIREDFDRGILRRKIMTEFNISKTQLYRIANRESWRQV